MFNEDDSHFFHGRQKDDLSLEDLNAWLDQYAGTQVREMVLNLNAQRSNVPSAVKQTMWDGYDPDADDSQPFFSGVDDNYRGGGGGHVATWRRLVHRMRSLAHRGIDPYVHWVQRGREKGLSPWISVRMNDVHYTDLPNHPIHDRIWREHPEWRVAPWRGDNLIDRCLDYARPAVYGYNLAYVQEMVRHYDVNGVELDWMRSCYNLRSGYEVQDSPILTRFHQEVRETLDAKEKEVGHPIQLGVRVPCHPESARRLGLDAVTWARKDLIDLVCIAPHLITDTDPPIELWRDLLHDTDVLLAATLFNGLRPSEGLGCHFQSLETARGMAASALDRGADRVALFNYFDSPAWSDESKERYRRLLREIGSLEAMAGKSRRQIVTYCDQWATGEAGAFSLPRSCAHDYGEEFRVPVGPGQRAQVRVAARVGAEAVAPNVQMRVNGAPCSPQGEVAMPAGFQKPMPYWDAPAEGIRPYKMHGYDVPEGALHRGDNAIEVRNRDQRDITLIWVEVAISDTSGSLAAQPIESAAWV